MATWKLREPHLRRQSAPIQRQIGAAMGNVDSRGYVTTTLMLLLIGLAILAYVVIDN